MSDSQTNNPVKAPWHLWAIGIIGTLWSAMGAMDYVMSKLKVESYMAAFTPEQLEFFYGFPIFKIQYGVLFTIKVPVKCGSGLSRSS